MTGVPHDEPTVVIEIPSADEHHDALIGLVDEPGVLGFEQLQGRLAVHVRASFWTEAVRARIDRTTGPLRSGPLKQTVLDPRNWNEEWERSIQPLTVGRFRIRPSWADPPGQDGPIDLVIDPQMSFGTGYHESTRLMLRRMPEFVEPDARVLDAGTGTGILAIAAVKLGAACSRAFDIDPWSIRNARENIERNGVAGRVQLSEGTLGSIPDSERFDLVLANINRAALTAMLPNLLERAPLVGLSGLMMADRTVMQTVIADARAEIVRTAEEGEWWSAWISRTDTDAP